MEKERDEVRILLLNNSLSQVWLINRLEEHGVITEKSELSSALSGAGKGAKVDKIIQTSLQILNDYVSKIKNE